MNLDFHSHILPGIDDGAADLNESLILADALKSWGFERVTCTPHITSRHRNTPETIIRAFDALQEATIILFLFVYFHAFNEAVQELFLLGVTEHIVQFIKAEEKGIIIRKTAVRYTRGRAKTFVR